MTAFAFETIIPAVSSTAAQVVIINPDTSGVDIQVTSVRLFGEQLEAIRARRYDVEVTTSVTGGDPPVPLSFDAPGATSAAEICTKDSHDITAPSANDLDFTETVFDNMGDLHLRLHEPILVPPGSTFALETVNDFGGSGPQMGFQLEYTELPAQPVEHIESAQLPAAGAFTDAEYFDVPASWSGLTFRVTYTAHGSSVGARPQWRVSSSDGSSDFINPIVSATMDTSVAPVAKRDQYQLADRWPSTVTANSTIHFKVPVVFEPGERRYRLDLAELGDTTNRGTAAVTIVGG